MPTPTQTNGAFLPATDVTGPSADLKQVEAELQVERDRKRVLQGQMQEVEQAQRDQGVDEVTKQLDAYTDAPSA